MVSDLPNAPSNPPEAKLKHPRSEQDQAIANDIADWLKLIKGAQTDAEIAPLLAGRGYEADDLEEGLELQKSAELAFAARQTARGEPLAASQGVDDKFAAAREEYVGFREIARKQFPTKADRTALGLNGRISGDLEKFCTDVTASYTAGKGAAYTVKLSKRGYSPVVLILIHIQVETNYPRPGSQAPQPLSIA